MTLLITAALGLAWQTITGDAAEHARAGIAFQQQGRLPDAITEFRKVTELAPEFPPAFVNLGAACLQNHDYAAAISPLKRALELNSNLPGAHQMLGYALLAQGYAAESIPHLQATNTWDALGIAQLKTGDFSAAITSLQEALKQRPNDPDLLYYLGRATGLLSKSAFDELEAAYPDSPRAHQALAETYTALHRTAEAEKEFKAALQSRPDAPGIHLALGQLYTKLADWPKAEAEFRTEATLQPGDSEAAYNLGQALLQEGKLPEARKELDRANALRPAMPETLYLLGKTAAAQGDNTEAQKVWTQLIAQEPQSQLSAQAHFGLANIFRKQGKTSEAEKEMQAFRQLQGKQTR